MTLDKDEQAEKALLPMVFTELPSEIDVRLGHLLKALLQIEVTLLPIVTERSVWKSQNT